MAKRSLRTITITFETFPLTLASCSRRTNDRDQEYAVLKDTTGAPFMCFDPAIFSSVEIDAHYQFRGMVNITPGNMFLNVTSIERVEEATEAQTS